MEQKRRVSPKWNRRYFLYVACFLCVNVVEFIIQTRYGDIRNTAVNCTGLVMMVICFSGCPMKELLRPANYIYTGVCAVLTAALCFWGNGWFEGYSVWNLGTAMLNVWWMGIFLGHMFRRVFVDKSVHIKFSLPGILWLILSVLMVCSVNDSFWPLWFFLMFGGFYLTQYSGADGRAMINGMIDGVILSFFIIQTYCYGFRPYDEVRYKGAYLNSNAMALFYLITYTMVLFRLHILEKENGKKGWKVFYLMGAGGLLCFIFITLGRTAFLTAAAETFVYGVVVVKKLWNNKWKGVIIKGTALLLAAAVTFPAVYGTVRWLPTILHHPVWNAGEYSLNKVHSFDPPDSEKYVDMGELLEGALGRVFRVINLGISKSPFALQVNAAEKIQVEKVEIPWIEDEAVLARFAAYKTYAENLTLYGHKNGDDNYWIGEWWIGSTHNIWLHIAYFWGIPAGIVFAALIVAILASRYRCLQKGNARIYAVMPFLYSFAYFLYGMAENSFTIGQLAVFLIFFVQHPMFRERPEEAKELSIE